MNVLRPTRPAPPTPAERITRGVCRHLARLGYATVTELELPNKRRADVVGLSASGEILIVEVKSGLPDFRADAKWQEYLPYCDGFAFAVDADFPQDVLPEDVGLVVTDGFQAAQMRPFASTTLHGSRRKALLLRFARTAAARLSGQDDPPV